MNLSPLPIQKFFGNDGRPLVGGLLFTYLSGTSTKTATYTDAGGLTPNTNPVVLDYRGECRLWIDPQQSYTFVLAPATDTDPPTNPIWTVNAITAGPAQQDNYATDTGSVNAIALAIPQISSPVAFTRIVFKVAVTNTGPVTITINGGTSKSLKYQNTAAFAGGEILAAGIYEAVFDGTQWQLQGPAVSYWITAAEIAASVTPTNYAIPSDSIGVVLPSRHSSYANAALVADQAGVPILGNGKASISTNTVLGRAALKANTSGSQNTVVGKGGLAANTTGTNNTAIGFNSLLANIDGVQNTAIGSINMGANTSGNSNVAVGHNCLNDNTTGSENVAVGQGALFHNIDGNYNVAVGEHALLTATTGDNNTAVGGYALEDCTGDNNTAVGRDAGLNITTGHENTAVGYQALKTATTAVECTAVGHGALNANTADGNTAVGQAALNINTSGANNTAIGHRAMVNNLTGAGCTAVGEDALVANTASFNTAVGKNAAAGTTSGAGVTALGYAAGATNTTGGTNTFVGYQADANANNYANTTAIGNAATCTASNQMTLGNASVATLRCQQTSITALSDRRFKKNIRSLELPDGAIEDLHVVMFEWIDDGMPQGPQVGFIAQELDEWQTRWGLEHFGLVDKSNPNRWEATPGKLLFPLILSFQKLSARVSSVEGQAK